MKEPDSAKRILKNVDAMLPTTENREALISLQKLCCEIQIPYMQDNTAFWVTSDKRETEKFLRKLHVPQPKPWHECSFPVIAKPVSGSGSENVSLVNSEAQLNKLLKGKQTRSEEFIIQEFIEGVALSLEALGLDGKPLTLQVTQLEFDSQFGCKRVFAPAEVAGNINLQLKEITRKIVGGLKLTGLTDVQAIVDKDSIAKVNEINARIPSQTPTVVFHSTGINMVELLLKLYLESKLPSVEFKRTNAVIYQHVLIFKKTLKVVGEHVLAEAKNLALKTKFMGADEAITNIGEYDNSDNCVATLIVKDTSLEKARHRMNQIIFNIMKDLQLSNFIDLSPVI